jgi:hypothetical protein
MTFGCRRRPLPAKNVFQLHGIDAAEKVAIRKQLQRSQGWHSSKRCQIQQFIGLRSHGKLDSGLQGSFQKIAAAPANLIGAAARDGDAVRCSTMIRLALGACHSDSVIGFDTVSITAALSATASLRGD